MFRSSNWLFCAVLEFVATISAFGQGPGVVNMLYDSGNTYRELTIAADGCTVNPLDHLCNLHKMQNWGNSLPNKQYNYRGTDAQGSVLEFMNWRMLLPVGYKWDGSVKYPMIVMLHGSGESGRLGCCGTNWASNDSRYDNNDHNIQHGGKEHQIACGYSSTTGLPSGIVKWPGIVVWPQSSYQAGWEGGWDGGVLADDGRMVTEIIEWLIRDSHYNVDPDRISIHGLSNGAQGLWDVAAKRPDLFAAILPMSGVPTNYDLETDPLVTMKIWQFQGGTDTNPNPQASMDVRDMLIAKGGTPVYTLYPTLGHGTWTTAYQEPNFWNFMFTANKKNIYVFGGDASICAGGQLKLGFSENYSAYQWTKDDVDIDGETGSSYFATTAGVYHCKFIRRTDDGSAYSLSNPVTVVLQDTPTFAPPVTTTGSIKLPISSGGTPLGGVNNVIKLTTSLGFSSYTWTKDEVDIPFATTNTYSFSAGTGLQSHAAAYRVRVIMANGCTSLDSDPVNVTWNDPQPTTPQPSQPQLAAVNTTTMNVTWGDVAGETGYEIWRYRFGFTSTPGYPEQLFSLQTILPANTSTYVDQQGLRPGAMYLYKIRAIQGSGGATFSVDSQPLSLPGESPSSPTPPTAPNNLVATNLSETSLKLTWDPAMDNQLVYKYEVYKGATLYATLTGSADGNPLPATTINVIGLTSSTTYIFNVRAVDYIGNYSPFTDGLTVTTLGATQGLFFKYWTFNGLLGFGDPAQPGGHQLDETGAFPSSFDFDQTPEQSGTISNFSIASAATYQSNVDPGSYVFSFDGYLDVQTSGTYSFRLTSNEGSRLYINGTQIVSSDGISTPIGGSAAGTQTTTGVALFAGRTPIRVTYFENYGGESLIVQWAKTAGGSTFVFQNIPNARLFLTATPTTLTNWYTRTSATFTDPSVLGAWTNNSSGTGGSTPLAFTGDYTQWNIRKNMTLASSWVVLGTISKVIVGDGTTGRTLTLDGSFTGTMDIRSLSTVNANNATVPTFGAIAANSTINFNTGGNVNVQNAWYGNVGFNSANTYTFLPSTTTIQGNLTVVNGAATTGTPNNTSVLRVGGSVTFNNTTGNPLPGIQNQQYSLIFVGSATPHTISFVNPVEPAFFSLQTDFNATVNFTNTGTHTYTFGSPQGGGLTLESGSTLNLGTGSNIVITGAGAINPNSETGNISINGGNFSFNSTGIQNSSVYFSDTGNSINDFSVSTAANTSVSVLSLCNIANVVTTSSGTLNSNSGSLTLLSTAGNTARIGALPTGVKITGSITAQRYLDGGLGRIYRYISSPVKGFSVADLQEFIPVTGNFAGTSSGTAPGLGNAASMFTYAEPTYSQFPPSTNLDTLRRAKGYAVFVREGVNPTTWEAEGTPNQGTIAFVLTPGTPQPNDGWNLLGNPYPSPIQWTGTAGAAWPSFNNISNTVYVRHNFGTQFQWFIYRPGITSGDLTGNQQILVNGVITSGQAFWVQADASPSLSIAEAAKYTADGGTIYRTGAPDRVEEKLDVLAIRMSNNTYSDIAFIVNDEKATDNYEKVQDAVKQLNSFFSLSTRSKDGISLAINATPATFCEKEVKLDVQNAVVGNYTLSFLGLDNFQRPVIATLKDNFLGQATEVNAGTTYTFAVTSDPASTGASRFVLTQARIVLTSSALKTSTVCENNPSVTLVTSQEGVEYEATFNGGIVSDAVTAKDNGAIDLTIDRHALGFGTHTITLVAGFSGCEKSTTLDQTISITIDTLETPAIKYESGFLVATPATASQYEWYLDGVLLTGKTDPKIPHDGGEGTYQVQVTSGSCAKISNAYRVTGTDQDLNSLVKVYPNPFHDQIVVTLPEKIQGGTVTLINPIGQKVHSQTIAPQDSNNVTLNFAGVEAGAYVLSVGRYKFKVIKVN